MEGGARRMVGNRFHENGPAPPTPRQHPTPEVGALARSAQCPPGAPRQRKIQQDNRVRSPQPLFDCVVGAKVAIHDPLFFTDEFLLQMNPLIARGWEKTRSPENFVQLDHGQSCDVTQTPGQG